MIKTSKMRSQVDVARSDSGLPWLWITEYLASSKEVDSAILHDLIDAAPEVPDDLEKAKREMVALRCLEDLFSPSNGLSFDDPPATGHKIAFSLSESCEDVLHNILQKTATSDMKMAGPELSKWDIHPFIVHKREMMPKCALQQLKDTILEGTHPLAASLEEISGLKCVNECGGTPRTLSSNGLSPSKRKRNVLVAKVTTGHLRDSLGESDPHLNAKKLKQANNFIDQSMEQISVPLHDKELLEDPSERLDEGTEGEGFDLANRFGDGNVEQTRIPKGGCDGDVNVIHQNKVLDSHNADNITQDMCADEPANVIVDEEDLDCTVPRTSLGGPSIRTQQTWRKDSGVAALEQLCEEQMSGDNDEYRIERFDTGSKKSRIVSSKCLLDCDYLPGWSEQGLCVKCNKNGQLLACSSSSCSLMVHENCLSSSANFDGSGKFYCPFCSYSLAISEYLKAKKNASLARKKLAAFMNMGIDQHHQSWKENGIRQENDENAHLREQENIHTNQTGQTGHEVNDHRCRKSVSDKQQSEPSASCFNKDLCCGEAANVNAGKDYAILAHGGKEGKDNLVDNFEDQVTANSECDYHNKFGLNTNIPSVDQREAAGSIQKEDLQQANTDPLERPIVALNIDGEETSESENDKFIISNYSIRFRRPAKKNSFPVSPQFRRKKLSWTSKEEELLKKGVRMFCTAHDRNIPWKKILEFGSSVFLSGRTTVDLKDKWRNMWKGSPRSK